MAGQFGIDPAVLTLPLAHLGRSPDHPYLGFVPGKQPRTIYLDTLHWVALGKARLGRPARPSDTDAYEFLRRAAEAGDIVIPLCATSYMEFSRTGPLRQRIDRADIVAELSGFASLIDATIAKDHQLATALAHRLGGPQPAPLHPFGIGIGFAFGKVDGIKLRRRDDKTRVTGPDVRLMEQNSTAILEYLAVRGPDDSDIAELRADGYRPEHAWHIEQNRVDRQKDLAEKLLLEPQHRHQLTAIAAARELYWEIADRLILALEPYGMTTAQFFGHGREWLLDFVHDVPCAAVGTALHDHNFRNSYKKWTGNDVRDIDAMIEAVPYCDYVLSDKHVVSQFAKTDLAERHGTKIFARLDELVADLGR